MMNRTLPSPTDGVRVRALQPRDVDMRLLVIRDAPRAGESWSEIVEIGCKKGADHAAYVIG